MLAPMKALDPLATACDDYATRPVAEAFSWVEVAAEVPPGEWYMVAFRSVHRPGTDEEWLRAYDDRAHREAMGSPGFVHYFKGPVGRDGGCMSFCLWDSRAEARAAAGRPAHVRAVTLTHEAYATYTLEFHRVRRRADAAVLEFEPYDAVEAAVPARARGRLAGSFAGADTFSRP